MHGHDRSEEPAVSNLSVLAYELNFVALAMAAEADSIARGGMEEAESAEAMARQMNDLIARLQRATKQFRYARRSGQALTA